MELYLQWDLLAIALFHVNLPLERIRVFFFFSSWPLSTFPAIFLKSILPRIALICRCCSSFSTAKRTDLLCSMKVYHCRDIDMQISQNAFFNSCLLIKSKLLQGCKKIRNDGNTWKGGKLIFCALIVNQNTHNMSSSVVRYLLCEKKVYQNQRLY